MSQSTDNPGEGPAAAVLPSDGSAAAGVEQGVQAQPAVAADEMSPSASTAATAAATAEAAAATAEAAAVTATTAAPVPKPTAAPVPKPAAEPVPKSVDAPDPDDPTKLERDRLTHPNLAVAVMLLFLIFSVAKLNLYIFETDIAALRVTGLASVALGLVTAVWFICCFTGDARHRITDIFVFAYAFTIGSFAMLVLPFVSDEPTTGVTRPATLELVRGCVRSSAMAGMGGVSAVVLCPADVLKATDVPASANVVKGNAWPNRRDQAGNEVSYNGPLRYTLMLVIGGVTATVIDLPATVPVAAVASAPGSASAASAGNTNSGGSRRYHEVIGGLAVPFFVLVMAYIGGAVSLSRRIPEYQRRLHPNYSPTDKEGLMRPFEAREVVVFQIMQLVSAPFLAVATWFIVSPMSLTTAATLAFGTGYASELLLLMIRGLVEGIRPAGNAAKPATP